MIKISIIIPTFNPSNLIYKCLLSVLNQSINKKYYEIILVDDNSKNNFYKKYKKIIKNNITYIKNKSNKGPGISRNIGIAKSTGSHILFLDSDDFLKKNSLKKIFLSLNKKKVDVIFYNYCIQYKKSKKFFKTKNKYINNKIKNINLFLTASIDTSSIFSIYDKKFLLKNNIYFKSGLHEDIFFMFKIFYNLKTKAYINDYLYIKNNYKNSIINTISKRRINDYFEAHNQIQKFMLKEKNIVNRRSFDQKIYTGQSGYCYEMLYFVIANIRNHDDAIYLLNTIFKYSMKLFKVDKMPKNTYKDKVVKYFFENFRKVNKVLKYNEFKNFILELKLKNE